MPRSMNVSGPTLTTPLWAGQVLHPETLLPGGAKIDAAQFVRPDAVVVTTTAAAALAATSIAVAALSGPIPNGTTLDFTGSGKFALLTVAAAEGATTLTVEALPTALASGDVATYPGSTRKNIASGIVVGRTLAERDAGTGFGPAAAADDEIFIVAFEVDDADVIDDVELLKPYTGFVVKENFLPGFASLAAGVITALRTRFNLTVGRD